MVTINPAVTTYDKELIAQVQQQLVLMSQELTHGYDTPYGALLAPSDTSQKQEIAQLVQQVQLLNPSLLLLCGIGGSNMGTLAVLQALGYTSPMKFMSADTIDERYTAQLVAQFRVAVEQGEVPIVCIVTKSGTTPETIINGSLFVEVLKELLPTTYAQHVVVITDEASPLHVLAVKEGYQVAVIPQQVGGRYSVFTAVGLFPLMLLGVDIDGLMRGAETARNSALDIAVEVNQTALTTLALYEHYKQGYQIHNLFAFSPYLVLLGHWYKQLIGESLGKKETVDGTLVEVGYTPVVSLGTTDLHSVAQLYLSGPRNTITTFMYFEDQEERIVIPHNHISELLEGMPGRTLTEVKAAIVEGTITAYLKEKRPSIVQPLEQSSESIGAFMMTKMIETILLGHLWHINPFDQPGVELYKAETRAILKKG